MLECRLTEFEQLPWPVTHVIVEARVTHRGDPKPLHFAEHRDRFERKWPGRILYVPIKELPGASPWDREKSQREHCRYVLNFAGADDIILHGDLDEIPRMSTLESVIPDVREGGTPTSLVMTQHLYAVDWYHQNLDQQLTVVGRRSDIERIPFVQLRSIMGRLRPTPNGGWHLSWIGGPEANARKLNVHCHLEMTAEEQYWPETGRAYREGRTHGGVWQTPVESLEDYPIYVRERRAPDSWYRPRP